MYRLEKDNVIRYAPDEKTKEKLIGMGYRETGIPTAKKGSKNDTGKS